MFRYGVFELTAVSQSGYMDGFFSSGMLTYGYLILIANVKIFLFTNNYQMLNILITSFSFLLYVILFALCSQAAWPSDLNAEFAK